MSQFVDDNSGKNVLITAKDYKRILVDYYLMPAICHQGSDYFGASEWANFVKNVTLEDNVTLESIQEQVDSVKV